MPINAAPTPTPGPGGIEGHITELMRRKKMQELQEAAASVDPALTPRMSGLAPPLNDDPRNIAEVLYSDFVVPARQKVAEFLGGKPDNPTHDLHEYYNEKIAEETTPFLGEPLTKAGLEAYGYFNEVPAYWAQVLSGKPGLGQQGFDQGDIEANRRGMERGFEKNRMRRSKLATPGTKI